METWTNDPAPNSPGAQLTRCLSVLSSPPSSVLLVRPDPLVLHLVVTDVLSVPPILVVVQPVLAPNVLVVLARLLLLSVLGAPASTLHAAARHSGAAKRFF